MILAGSLSILNTALEAKPKDTEQVSDSPSRRLSLEKSFETSGQNEFVFQGSAKLIEFPYFYGLQ